LKIGTRQSNLFNPFRKSFVKFLLDRAGYALYVFAEYESRIRFLADGRFIFSRSRGTSLPCFCPFLPFCFVTLGQIKVTANTIATLQRAHANPLRNKERSRFLSTTSNRDVNSRNSPGRILPEGTHKIILCGILSSQFDKQFRSALFEQIVRLLSRYPAENNILNIPYRCIPVCIRHLSYASLKYSHAYVIVYHRETQSGLTHSD
jgi:hypothetical protein